MFQDIQRPEVDSARDTPGACAHGKRRAAKRCSSVIFACELMQMSADGRARLLSPLRYPGAKRQLIPMFDSLLRDAPCGTFIEPFAGGASVSLHVAANGLADRVVLGESDPLVYHFWQTACFDTDWLIEQVETVDISLSTWDMLRDAKDDTPRGQALACLFLNRTSFSGILHRRAGPIGGRAQRSAYGIDCRFPRGELVRRLQLVGNLAEAGRIRCRLPGRLPGDNHHGA